MNTNTLMIKMSCLAIAICAAQHSFADQNQAWSQDRQWLLGDWNGQRQQLEKDGYKFTAAIMSQSATNLDGGYNDDNALKMQRN
jgi:porin